MKIYSPERRHDHCQSSHRREPWDQWPASHVSATTVNDRPGSDTGRNDGCTDRCLLGYNKESGNRGYNIRPRWKAHQCAIQVSITHDDLRAEALALLNILDHIESLQQTEAGMRYVIYSDYKVLVVAVLSGQIDDLPSWWAACWDGHNLCEESSNSNLVNYVTSGQAALNQLLCPLFFFLFLISCYLVRWCFLFCCTFPFLSISIGQLCMRGITSINCILIVSADFS